MPIPVIGDMLNKLGTSLAIGTLRLALPYITAELRKMMVEAVQKWDDYARQTPYDWDNHVVDALKTLLHVTEVPLVER